MEKPSGSAAVGAKAQVEKQARQLAYDTRYKVKSDLKAKSAGGKVDPAAVSKLYMAQLAKSTAAPPVKQRAKEMLMGEDYVDTRRLVVDSAASALYKVFVEGIDEKVEEIEEEKGDKTYKVRVTDKDSGKSYVRMASREKIAELRSNPNIASVEMTEYGEPTRSETAGKKAKKDYDGDGKIESGSKEHAGVVHNAIQRSKGGKADGKDTRKEGYSWKDGFAELIEKKDEEEKKITGEGVNNKKLIKVFPDDVKEQMEGETEDPSMKSKLKKANMAKKQVLMKKLQAVRMGAGDDIQASNELEGEVELDENRAAARAAGGYKDDSKKQPDPSKKGFTGIGNMSIDQIRKMSARIEKEKTQKEEVEGVDEAMSPGPRREKMRAKMHDPYVKGGSKSRGQAHNIAVRGDVSTADPAIKSRGGGGVEKDKGMGYGDRGAGNKARRRAGQEPMRGNTRTEEVEMKKDQKSDGRDTPTKVKLALARLRAKGMKVASPIVAPSNRDTAELPPLGEGINAYPASLRARTMGMSKADRQKHFDAYDAKKKGEEKKVSEGVVKKDYIGPLYAAWQDVIAGNSNTAAKFEEGIGIDQQMKISQDYNRMSPEEKLAANKKAMGNVKKVAPKKDTRTDAEKMTDAVGKPRMGSSGLMPAVSKKQQRFFGIVRAIQKGEMAPTTPETAKAAADMKKSDVKDFASTKHKKLPEKKVAKEESNLQERGDFWHPDPEKDRKLGGPGANQRAREDRPGSSKPKSDPKKLRPGESYMQYAKRMRNEETKYDRYDKQDKENKKRDDRMKFGKFYAKAKEAKDRLRPGEVKKWDPEKKRYVSNKE